MVHKQFQHSLTCIYSGLETDMAQTAARHRHSHWDANACFPKFIWKEPDDWSLQMFILIDSKQSKE